MVIKDIKSYEQTREAIALLKILSLGSRQIEEGKFTMASEVIKRVRKQCRPGP